MNAMSRMFAPIGEALDRRQMRKFNETFELTLDRMRLRQLNETLAILLTSPAALPDHEPRG